MRYFEFKPSKTVSDVDGKELKVDYVDFFKQVIMANTRLSTDGFLRMAAFYQKFLTTDYSQVLEIEDQDYGFLKAKLDEWISSLRGFAITIPEIAEFINDFQKMPTKKDDKKEEKQIDK